MPSKILIVEDNADSRDMLTTVLAAEGYEVITAEDGRAGLELALAEHPNIILTDIQMPNLDGVEMIRHLRSMPAVAEVPVLVMTAFASGSISDAMRAGANHGMRKPLDLNGLLRALAQLLKSD
jgi:two-component system, cell cycle response regulator DivK